jgi:hypothetical protein
MELPRRVCESLRTILILVLTVCPIQVRADVTVTQHGKQGGVAPSEAWTRKIRIKGLKMRVETLSGKESRVSIYNLETGKRFRFNAQRKEVFVLDLASLSEHM